ncbi:ABC transporter ATP-binding protein [Melissococcus plutonius]|uniref:Lipid A export ATP-binding/permease protein MsbA n=1 Tax=Melissococcus plutonius (strain ATCC 35311 / DSM 29964 / CIP 104052 / LMG 20360 / NCIMB 702443) TaxID=940190 RepID=F3Y857_MELPT|nr:ABC transporter ATP-binding protein [Melissococcus plutonius]AIM24429.1 ABC-type multidrug transport system, ATPase/permease component [Melissococcus plutonius S1]KMT25825.1 ABC-type multidrug transport system, ATPase/permease component [Melissococcus plutonius]KMT27170.1 ABC-type multidrug transport system, ATPase/permease component [Melissococcus plutonius]KMT28271.1 ABC-type multidrug transport system, ATPase/permease component [Melissococcus plutonius]KMT30008.1 ABC-type multidrug trans
MKKAISSMERLGKYIKPYRLTFYSVIFLTILTTVFNVTIPYVTGLPTTRISKDIAQGKPLEFTYIFWCLFWLLIIGIGYCVSQFLSNYLMTNVVQNAMRDLRKDIEEKINRLPVSYFDKNQQGNILSRVTNDVDAVSNALQQSFINIISAILGIIMAVAMMFYINTLMALFSILMIPLSIVISQTLIRFSQKYFYGMQNTLGELNGFVQENMTGFSVLKLYGREKETLNKFKKVNHKLNQLGFKATFISGIMMPLVQLTAYSTYIGMAVLGSYFAITGIIVVGQLQAFIQYIWQVNQPMGNITQLATALQSASAATTRVFEILDQQEEPLNEQDIPLPEPIHGNVEFDHVSFSYDPKKPLIKNLSFKVKAGQTVAIVGPTGAGKTTLINLLMRFYDVNYGAIKIDGIDTKKMNRSDVRSVFGMVLQDAWLYKGTIVDNIRFGKLDATDYEVVDAAKTANVNHFIRTMPNGYEMEINAEGDNISLGQKQLLTIARAVISDPKILILDEATSSVDTRLEALIQKAMDQVMRGRTSFVIAHRLSTIREADLILVMNQGEIIEKGTHIELLEQGGFYEKLYNSQFAEESE